MVLFVTSYFPMYSVGYGVHGAPLNLLAPAANTRHGTEMVFKRCWWSDLTLILCPPWLCIISLVGYLLCCTSYILGSPFWPNPCCGTNCALELTGNLGPQLYPHLSRFPITALCKPRRKRESTPWETTTGRWELMKKKKNAQLFHVSGNNVEVHSTQLLKGPQWDCIPVTSAATS